jgi:YD repeat-containing protein
MDGAPGSVNIFGVSIGGYRENSFPSDVSPGVVDGFSIVVAHEVNHVVDVYSVYGSPALNTRRQQLIQQAGVDPANYLRGGQTGFFYNNPQEFFASIANQWFTDSAKTIELGIRRFEAGRLEPINQALFFAEVYSLGGASAFFYTTDVAGNITRTAVPLTRDAAGHITTLRIVSQTYVFTRDAAGNVQAITVATDPDTKLDELAGLVRTLSNAVFKAGGHRTALLSILGEIQGRFDTGNAEEAYRKLENLRRKVDGCNGSSPAQPDPNDWITDCESQRGIRGLIDDLLEAQ